MELSGLNPPQRSAVTHRGGPLLVLAGAGSGKTRVITHRIAQLLDEGIEAGRIAALTFTNRAAAEMRERVAILAPGRRDVRELSMGTFHSLGLHLLRRERQALGLPRGFAVYDTADQLGVIRELLRTIDDGGRRYDIAAIATRISLAKNALCPPDQYEPIEGDDYGVITAEIYPRYQAALRGFAAFDFDDLILEPLRLLREHPDVQRRWRSQFRHVLVDEYQDTNRAQLLLLKELCTGGATICAVGDDDQSIYSWRGAQATQILHFERDFPGATVVVLDQNYRSTPAILDAANAVIAHNKGRRGKELWSERSRGPAVVKVTAHDPEAEARFVAGEIRRLMDEEGRSIGEFAVLYRSNIQTRDVEELFRLHGLEYTIFGGQQFYERKEVKDVLAYLRLALNHRDEIALRRVLNYPARGIGAGTLEKLVEATRERRCSLWDAIKNPPELSPRALRAVEGFAAVIEKLTAWLETEQVSAAARHLIAEIALHDDIRAASTSGSAARRRIDNLESLLRSLERFEKNNPDRRSLADYLRRLTLETSDDSDRGAAGQRIILTTLHGSKGLEFPVVFFIGLEEELIPHIRTLMPRATDVPDPEHATDLEEERRLVYVGMTRAQDVLYMSRAHARRIRGKPVPRTPSRFLAEIPDELAEHRDVNAEEMAPVEPEALSAFFAGLADS